MHEPPPTPEELLARVGLDAFRPGQREAVQAALAGRDSLIVMPTGGGKSLCYQLPALAGDGLVVVVSPLIALMADQLERVRAAGVRACMLASGMPAGQNERALADISAGAAQLVLAAPERFASSAFRAALARRRVSLFAVDEAHCVAEWGHDFRPDYLRLREAAESLSGAGAGAARTGGTAGAAGAAGTAGPRPPVMATTATATPRVAEEIAQRLGLRECVQIRSGFDRPNICFDVVSVQGTGALARKRAVLSSLLAQRSARPAIVYCGTRRDTERLAAELDDTGIATVAYHAGMDPQARAESQRAFMCGQAEVVVATSAFGMGVDKADVRTVAHWALPTSLEAYYQEAGRAGRDGGEARALLLSSRVDLGRLIRFNGERRMSVADVRSFVAALRDRAGSEDGAGGNGGASVVEIAPAQLSDRERVLLSIAERAGAVELRPDTRAGLAVTLTGRGSPRRAHAAIRAAQDRGWESYRSIERFSSDGERCRRRQILEHFGDREQRTPTGRCCDVCEPDPAIELALASAGAMARSRGRARRGAQAQPRPDRGARAHARSREGREQAPEPAALSPGEERQFEQLRAWRLRAAAGKPAFTVASDATLRELLRVRPASTRELIGVRGIGRAFCEKHGSSLLELLGALPGEGPPRSALPEADRQAGASIC